jgi:antitoxin FitA
MICRFPVPPAEPARPVLTAGLARTEIGDYNACSFWSRTLMSSITVRNLEPALKEQLRVRAARHGRSMEEEVRHILRDAIVEQESEEHLVDVFAELFGPEHGVELRLPPREPGREPPDLG